VASAGPYTNHLHLTQDKTTMPAPHHLIFTGWCSSWRQNQRWKPVRSTGAGCRSGRVTSQVGSMLCDRCVIGRPHKMQKDTFSSTNLKLKFIYCEVCDFWFLLTGLKCGNVDLTDIYQHNAVLLQCILLFFLFTVAISDLNVVIFAGQLDGQEPTIFAVNWPV